MEDLKGKWEGRDVTDLAIINNSSKELGSYLLPIRIFVDS